MTSEIMLSPDQQAVLDAVLRWYADAQRTGRGLRMTVGGLAGTGKSTLVQKIRQSIQHVRVCAYTGKAAHVLRTKGVGDATTIHSLIYEAALACSNCGHTWDACRAGLEHHRVANHRAAMRGKKPVPMSPRQLACRRAKQHVEFILIETLPCDLVIVDEASMVNRDLLSDLESFGIPVLFVGDHGQLEPVGPDPGLMREPDVRLEKIHRQAEGNPIVQFAHRVRMGYAPRTIADDARVIECRGVPADAHLYDVVICGYNKTRCDVNAKIRKSRGFQGELPQPGERVVCLRNDKTRKIFNGMQATVEEIVEDVDDGFIMTVVDDLGARFEALPIVPDQFGALETLRDASPRKTLWDFGYCLTAHKSQGSEYDRVLVLEQIARSWSPERWRYTVATRAAKHLTYCVRAARR